MPAPRAIYERGHERHEDEADDPQGFGKSSKLGIAEQIDDNLK
jgi:hypothetical protein